MRYSTIKFNDVANAPGICVSIYLQGCPHKCKGCFNPETWDFDGGKKFTDETMDIILSSLKTNGINRSLCILGGEPLCKENVLTTLTIAFNVKQKYPETKIYCWTGYLYEDLLKETNILYKTLLDGSYIDYLIDGPFIEELKDLRLKMRGSSNQRIINLSQKKLEN